MAAFRSSYCFIVFCYRSNEKWFNSGRYCEGTFLWPGYLTGNCWTESMLLSEGILSCYRAAVDSQPSAGEILCDTTSLHCSVPANPAF